jgi:hypothetical protein
VFQRAKELGQHTQKLVRNVLRKYPSIAKTIANVAPAPVLKALNISAALRDQAQGRDRGGWSR